MTVTVKEPSHLEQFTDKDGRPTFEAQKYFQQLQAKIAELEARLVALEP